MANKAVFRILLLLFLAIALFFGLYKLSESPPVWYDEGLIIQPAINWERFNKMGIQVAPGQLVSSQFISTGYPVIYPVSVVFNYFGISLVAARLVSVAYLILLIGLFFILGWRAGGYKYAVLSAFLLVSFPPLYGHGKNVLGEVPGLFFLILFLYFVNKIERNLKNKPLYLLAGLSAGLSVVTKPLFLVLLPAIFIALLLQRRQIKFYWSNIILSVIAFFIPFFIWLQTQFASSNVLAAIWSFYSNPYGVQNLGEVIRGNLWRFTTEAAPVYFGALLLIWASAVVIRYRKKETLSLGETISFIFSVLVFLAYLRTAGWYRYFFPAQVLAFLFVPRSLTVIADWLRTHVALLAKFSIMRSLPLIIVVLLTFLQFYQLTFNSWVAEHYNSTRSRELGVYFSKFTGDKSVFVYDSPELIVFLPQSNYWQYLEFTESLVIGQEQLQLVKQGVPDLVIAKSNIIESQAEYFSLYKKKETIDRYTLLEK